MSSLVTAGEPWPLPGSLTFHLMFSLGDQVVGTSVSVEVPSPRGPRHWGHSSALTDGAKHRDTETQRRKTEKGFFKDIACSISILSLCFSPCLRVEVWPQTSQMATAWAREAIMSLFLGMNSWAT